MDRFSHSRQSRARAHRRRATVLAGPVLAIAGLQAGCGSSGSGGAAPRAISTPTASATPSASYPVTVTNCGVPATYTKAPTRAVSNDINTTEDMLALGLESHMAGDFGVTGDGPAGDPVPAQYLAGFHQVPDISPGYFTLEKLVGLHPDFLFAGWNYGLQTGTNLTPDGLATYGIKVLALTESCTHVQPGKNSVSIDNTYQDLRNLGVIFGVPRRAQQVISGLQAKVAAVRAKVAKLKPVTVFDYDSGDSAPFTAGGLATPQALISLAGGTNIFASLKQSFTSVSWEKVVAANPQCIIINDYGTPTAKQKERFLETSKITRNLTAVRNKCFLPLAYDEITPGPRNADAVTAIAHLLHPAAFGLRASGS